MKRTLGGVEEDAPAAVEGDMGVVVDTESEDGGNCCYWVSSVFIAF